MRVNRRRRLTPGQLRRDEQRAKPDTAAESAAEAEPDAAPEPPRREHLYGSTYRVRMSFDELMATRGYIGEQVIAQRRRLVAPSDTEWQRNAASEPGGYARGEVLWPSE